jgi:putative tricarboxylic transport membrane protein
MVLVTLFASIVADLAVKLGPARITLMLLVFTTVSAVLGARCAE